MKTTIHPSTSSSCVRGCNTAPGTLFNPNAAWSSQQGALWHVALPHNWRHPFCTPNPSLLAPCAAGQGWGQPGSEPEEAAYNELLARRREERMQTIREASRRARFNPLNRKADAPAPELQQYQQEQPAQQLPQSPPASAPGPITFKSGGSKAKSAVPGQHKQRPAGAPMRPALSAHHTRRKGGGVGNMARRSMPSSMQQRRQQLGLAGDDTTDDVFDDSEDDDDEDDDIDPQTMAGLEALAAQLMQEGGLEELDVTVDGEPKKQQGSPIIGQGSTGKSAGKERGAAARPAAARAQGEAGKVGALNGSSSSKSGMRAKGRPQPRDPFQDPAFIQRLEALMADDSDDDDDAIDVDAQGVQGKGQGLLSQLPGGERINHKEMEDMEDIDWDALVAYDSLEKSVEEEQQLQQQQQRRQRQMAAARQQQQQQQQPQNAEPQASQSPPLTGPFSELPPAKPAPSASPAAPGAGQALQRPSRDLAVHTTPSTSPSSPSRDMAVRTAQAIIAGSGAQTLSDTEFEDLVRVFEGFEEHEGLEGRRVGGQDQGHQGRSPEDSNSSSSNSSGSSGAALGSSSSRSDSEGKQSLAAASSSSSRAVEGASGPVGDGVDWQALERVFLGRDWERRELAGLADSMAKISASQPGSKRGAEEEEEDPWADEVTGVLLALVLLSHKQYLQEPLLPEDMPEEARTLELWNAPFALLVHDDSKAQALEYANKQALAMLGIRGFEDIYNHAAPDFVDDDAAQQQEWLWASAEVEDQYKHTAVIPQMRFRKQPPAGSSAGQKGAVAVANNVQLFRVDSLEGDPIGTAMLVREWS